MMSNADKIGTMIAEQMRKTVKGNTDTWLDFGTISDNNLTLVPDTLRVGIPAGSYLMLDGYIYLERGYRVLIGWVGNTPIILGKLRRYDDD